MICRNTILLSGWLLLASAGGAGAQGPASDVVLWPEDQRAFAQDGPASLLSEPEKKSFLAADEAGRQAFIASFLARATDLASGIERRRRLVIENDLSPLDDRGRLLFLRGAPQSREVIDCGLVFRPLELWTYGVEPNARNLLLYQPLPGELYRLWIPTDSKRVLYTDEMEYFLDQWEELRRFISGRRFDYQICKPAKRIDEVSGVSGLTGFKDDRPTDQDMLALMAPPADLGAWAREALATDLSAARPSLPVESVEVRFPKREGQRMVARLTVKLPASANLGVANEGEEKEHDLAVDVSLEKDGKVFDKFRVRFTPQPGEQPAPVALVFERPLRPEQAFLLRLVVSDEISGARARLNRGIAVPAEPEPMIEVENPADLVVALGQHMAEQRIGGADSLVLVPPEGDVVLGLWRAEALVTGNRIAKITFLVDGKVQLTRSRPPFSAEIRLDPFPREQVVRVEGYDEAGELVASDEVMLNQPRGALRVRIVEPRRGYSGGGTVDVKAEVVVPEERRVEFVEFLLGDVSIVRLNQPPWQTNVEIPAGEELSYVTVVAQLDDGSRAEDVRFLNNPEFLEEVDVELVELFTTVTDRTGRPVPGLVADDFEIFEENRPQKLAKFELVEDLPLTIGVTLDTSGSMMNALYEAQRAASGFLENIVTRKDRCFAIAFADKPVLLMPPTNDVEAVDKSLQGLLASGFTSLHDAVVHSLYYFRGVRGRKALILLSDGDDTSSHLTFDQALEYARFSGVSVYTIGLGVGGLDLGIRNKLENLASETGGRAFFIKKSEELGEVYEAIEAELRSQYLLAYTPDRRGEAERYRLVEVKVKKSGLKARTVRGYYE